MEAQEETGSLKNRVALVVLNWNGKKLLEEFVPKLLEYGHPQATLYIADNASTDDSLEYVRSNFPEVKWVQNEQNGGYAKGYNDALARIDAEIFALVNSDIEVTPGWLDPVIAEFETHPDCAAIQPKILDYKRRGHFEYAGAAGGFIDKLGYPYCKGRVFMELEADNGQYDDNYSIFWATGACFFIRSKVFMELRGFDEDFFAHLEEIDLCWRVHNRGYDIRYVGASEVYHVGGATLTESNPRKTFLNFRNSLFTLVKNLPSYRLLYILPIRIALDIVAELRFLLQFKPHHAWAIVKAHASFVANFYKMYEKRDQSAELDKKYYKVVSVVWEHFVKGKRTFDQLQS